MLSPDALPGGGGGRVRAHVLDGEGGGAKGHDPNRPTGKRAVGSAVSPFFCHAVIFPPRARARLCGGGNPARLTWHHKGMTMTIRKTVTILLGGASAPPPPPNPP